MTIIELLKQAYPQDFDDQRIATLDVINPYGYNPAAIVVVRVKFTSDRYTYYHIHLDAHGIERYQ